MGFLPKEARSLGSQVALEVGLLERTRRSRRCWRCTSKRAPSGLGGGCFGASVRARVGGFSDGVAWEHSGCLKGPGAEWDWELGQPRMPWPHVLSEAAYGLMKAVSPVEDDVKKKKKIRICGRITARADGKGSSDTPRVTKCLSRGTTCTRIHTPLWLSGAGSARREHPDVLRLRRNYKRIRPLGDMFRLLYCNLIFPYFLFFNIFFFIRDLVPRELSALWSCPVQEIMVCSCGK